MRVSICNEGFEFIHNHTKVQVSTVHELIEKLVNTCGYSLARALEGPFYNMKKTAKNEYILTANKK